MEMVLKYVVMNRQRDEEKKRARQLRNVSEDWYPMHGSTAHKISIFAGRRKGKTLNILLRAIRSSKDVLIYTGNSSMPSTMLRMIRDLVDNGESLPITSSRSSGPSIMLEIGNRSIKMSPVGFMNDDDWTGKLILVDEFDNEGFERLMHAKEGQISRAYQIICVGSMRDTMPSYGKSWFNESDVYYYIDREDRIQTRGRMMCEYFPSRYQSLISNMPPPHMSPASGIQVTLRL